MKTLFRTARFLSLLGILVICAGRSARGTDWPMWRADPQRSATTSEALGETLALQWTLELAPPEPCWPWEQFRIRFDASYEPIVADGLLFVPSMVTDSVAAYEVDTGARKWQFQTGGPVRFAPLYHEGRLYVVSDDGHLYCLQAEDGGLLWKFRGGPSNHLLLGNKRLISMWPARGAPVIDDEGVVFFAAGIWPFLGTFIHALDAESGEVVWTNSGSGSDYILQPHNTPSFAGVAPQGFLTLHGDTLLVAGGRSTPAAYDRRTGAFRYFKTDTKRGFHAVLLAGDYYFNDGIMYRVSNGNNVISADPEVIDGDRFVSTDDQGRVAAWAVEPEERVTRDRRGEETTRLALARLWRLGEADEPLGRVFLKAGERLYTGSPDGWIQSIAIPEDGTDGADPEVTWRARIDGAPWSMLAAGGRLFVVTEAGAIHCFGPTEPREPVVHGHPRREARDQDLHTLRLADAILGAAGAREGYCLVVGAGSGRLAEAL